MQTQLLNLTYRLVYNKLQASLCNGLCNTFTVAGIASRTVTTNAIVNKATCQASTS